MVSGSCTTSATITHKSIFLEIVVPLEGDELSLEESPNELDHFLIDRLFSSQDRRLEDQRCPLAPSRTHVAKIHTSKSVDELILLISDKQFDRLDDQRAPLSNRKVRKEFL